MDKKWYIVKTDDVVVAYIYGDIVFALDIVTENIELDDISHLEFNLAGPEQVQLIQSLTVLELIDLPQRVIIARDD